MFVTESGILTDLRLLQPPKTDPSMYVMELGIVTDVSPVQQKYLEVIDSQLFAVNTVEK